jgi:hypothetical protein
MNVTSEERADEYGLVLCSFLWILGFRVLVGLNSRLGIWVQIVVPAPAYPTFHVFLSNVGNSPTVASDLLFQYITPNIGGESAEVLNATILRPGDSHEWTLSFTLSSVRLRTNLTAQFAIVTTNGTVMKMIRYDIVPCC